VFVCVVLRLNASLNEFPTHGVQSPITDMADFGVCGSGGGGVLKASRLSLSSPAALN